MQNQQSDQLLSDLEDDSLVTGLVEQEEAPDYNSIKEGDDPVGRSNDPVVGCVIERLVERSNRGIQKYGNTIGDDNSRSTLGWIDETIEELLDAAVYLQRLRVDIAARNLREQTHFTVDKQGNCKDII